MSSNTPLIDGYSKEERVLRLVKRVLADVARDTHAPPGTRHPLSDATVQGIRDCFSMIVAREQEISQARGQENRMRPRYVDEPPKGPVEIKINVDAIRRKPIHE